MKFFDFNTNSTPNYINSSHFSSLDGLRAISIIFVLIGHSYRDIYPFITGSFGVQVFFVISGFLITTLLIKEKTNTGSISLRKFYIRRFLRIFPVAYLYLLVIFIISLVLSVKIELNEFLTGILYVRNTSILETTGHYVGHFWSISLEEQFYLFCPFLLAININNYLKIILVFLITLPFINYASFHFFNGIPILNHFTEMIRGFTPILVGSLLGILNFYGKIHISLSSRYKTLASLILLLGASFIHTKLLPWGNTFLLFSSLPIGLVLIINIVPDSHKYNYFYRFLNSKYICQLGVLSYSIYIWQQIFTLYKPWKGYSVITDNQIVNLFALAIVSYMSYYFYERWFLKLKKRFA